MKKIVLTFLLSSLSLNAQTSTADETTKEQELRFKDIKHFNVFKWTTTAACSALFSSLFAVEDLSTKDPEANNLIKTILKDLNLVSCDIKDNDPLLLFYPVLGATAVAGLLGYIVGKIRAHKNAIKELQNEVNRDLISEHPEIITNANTTRNLASALNEWGAQEDLSPKNMLYLTQNDCRSLRDAIAKLEVLKNENPENKNLYGLAISKVKEKLARLNQVNEILYSKVYGTI